MRRWVNVAGVGACLLALVLVQAGPWAVVQAVAWGRMLIDYSRDHALSRAWVMTFDGDHPCPMCHKVREGRQQEEQQAPLLKWEKQPEFFLEARRVPVPLPPSTGDAAVPVALQLESSFAPAPPKPPPRAV